MTLKEYLESLDDSSFLEVASLYLGKVAMPFNKARLIEALVQFFQSSDICRRIIERCDDEDARLLSALCFFGKCSQEVLVTVSAENRIKTLMRIRSLIKRLLILPSADGLLDRAEFLDYTPLLSSAFIERRSDVKSLRIEESIYAMLSLISSHRFKVSSARAERSFIAAGGTAMFPLLSEDEATLLFSKVLNAGLKYGFILNDGGYAVLDCRMCALFLQLPAVLQSAVLSNFEERTRAEAVSRRASLFSLLTYTDNRELPLSMKLASSKSEIEEILNNDSFLIPFEEDSIKSECTISADFTIYGRTFRNSELYRIAEIRKVDTLITYELTRESIKAGFDSGLDDAAALAILEKLSTVPIIIRERIKAWYEQYQKIRVYDALYVEADERSARLISTLPLLQIHIIRRIGETGFLFKRKSEEQWRRIMMYSGLDMIGRTEKEEGFDIIEDDRVEERQFPEEFSTFIPYSLSLFPPERRIEENRNYQNILRLYVNEKIKDKSEKDGYLSYIQKGYVVAESQIVPGKQFPRTRSASGFDFQAKLQLLSSCAGREDLVVSLTMEEISIEGVVLSLDRKAENSTVTILDAESQEELTLEVGKIFLIKVLSD